MRVKEQSLRGRRAWPTRCSRCTRWRGGCVPRAHATVLGEPQIQIVRIIGSVAAEDLLEQPPRRARASKAARVGPAAHQIATNRALDASGRPDAAQDLQRTTEMPDATRYGEPIWLEPFPDVLLEESRQAPGPGALRDQGGDRGGVHRRPSASVPPQPAVLVLRDVLGCRAEEVAGCSTPPRIRRLLAPPDLIARLCGIVVILTLEGQQISAITWFGDNSAFPQSGCRGCSR